MNSNTSSRSHVVPIIVGYSLHPMLDAFLSVDVQAARALYILNIAAHADFSAEDST